MTCLRRICIVLLLVLTYGMMTFANARLRTWLTGPLGDGSLARSISVSAFTALCMLPALHPQLRRGLNLFRLRLDWTLLLLLPYPVLNVIFGQGIPTDRPGIETAHLMWLAINIGVHEELLFRGYALHQAAGHPKFAIFVSALVFALIHWLGGHSPLALIPVFFFGVAFGIVRIVSESLSWCIVFHATTNLTAAVLQPHHTAVSLVLYLLAGVSAAVAFWKHPKLRIVQQMREDSHTRRETRPETAQP